jgi:coenzyme PQQ synthesis protein D (PqqD)
MMKYSLAKHVVFRKTNSELCMLFDRDRGVMYELNETASAAIGRLQGTSLSQEEIVESLGERFAAEPDELTRDVAGFLGDFVAAGLLETA